MASIDSTQLLKQLKNDNQFIINQINKDFLALPENILNQKPDPKSWSVLECIEHLNLANETYISQMENHLSKSDKQEIGKPLRTTFFSNWMVNMMMPKADKSIPNKMGTMSMFTPTSALNKSVLNEYLNKQNRLIAVIENSGQHLDLNKNIIVSPVNSMIRFKLGNAMRFITAHSQRHMVQATNALAQIS